MSKSRDTKKDIKKKPVRSVKEKRKDKHEKKKNRSVISKVTSIDVNKKV